MTYAQPMKLKINNSIFNENIFMVAQEKDCILVSKSRSNEIQHGQFANVIIFEQRLL